MRKKIKELSKYYLPRIKDIRRRIHEYPEIGFEEEQTSKFIQEVLTDLAIPFEVMCKTGVVGLIKGGKPGKTILLRADMDALPVEELADVPYKSKIKGKMHACGHDGHVAGLLGAAMILNDLKTELAGNVKLMFQPAEETTGGALPMIEAGILENPTVDAALGLHLWGPLKKGHVQVCVGPMMAAADTFHVTIQGRGGHAAMPHLCIDPISIVGQAVNSLQTIISRKINPLHPAVLSICQIQAGDATNIIPETASFSGTVRTFQSTVRKEIPEYMQEFLQGICKANGAQLKFDYHYGYPALINNQEMTNLVYQAVSTCLGEEHISYLPEPNMGGEDFAYLCERVPAAFYFVGIAEENKPNPVHHHPEFQWDDSVLEISAATLAQATVNFLNAKE